MYYGYPDIIIEKIINANNNKGFVLSKGKWTWEVIYQFQCVGKLSHLL